MSTEQMNTEQGYGDGAEAQQTVEVFKCKNCGNDLSFDPKSGKMACEHCGTQVDIEINRQVAQKPVDFNLDAAPKWGSETRTFKCDNCGATSTFDKTEFSTECAYCGSNKVQALSSFQGIKPDALLPFVLDPPAALTAWKTWLKKRLFAPRKMKKEAEIGHIKGVYCPFWSFDTNTFSSYSGIAGKYYYVTVGSGNNRRTERRVRWFPVRGTYNKFFKDLLVEASPHLTPKDIKSLQPFPMDKLVVYDKRFLSGFSADFYDKGLKEGWDEGAKIMDDVIRNDIKRAINADVIQTLNVSTNYADAKFKHVLLPVYVSRASFREKIYNFFINGVNGRVSGKTPVGVGKALIAAGIGLLALGGILAAVLFGMGIL